MILKVLLGLVCLLAFFTQHAYGYVEYPQAVGDLVFRDSEGVVYGRDSTSCVVAPSHPGHVGIYLGGNIIIEALGWFGEVVYNRISVPSGEWGFYTNEEGDPVHNPLGAKAHRDLLNNPNATTLRDNIKFLAIAQWGEGFDSDLSTQKGPDNNQWTCCGFAEKIYESCAGQTLIYHSNYGDEHLYEGGLNITPDGYNFETGSSICYFQIEVEFSQIADNLIFGRPFGALLYPYIFFPYTQFLQPTLIDSFAVRKPEPDIKANNLDSKVVVSPNTPTSISVSLDPGGYAGQNADWWVASDTPFGWYTYVYPTGWTTGINPCLQTGLFDLSPPVEVLNQTLPIGRYIFYFALDDPDGAATGPWWGLDSVEVNVQATNSPPTATITSPSSGTTFTEGDEIGFIGSGTDPEDGQLTGNSLIWASDKDGQIGTGKSFIKSNLSVNTHKITLTAKDSKGATSTDSVTIKVTSASLCDPHEPNDSFAQAKYLGDSQGGGLYKELGINSYICSATDVDYFKIIVNSSVFMLFIGEGEVYYGKDYDIYLYDSSYNEIAKSATRPIAGGINMETIDYLMPSQGTYYIKVVGYNGAYAADKNYLLSVMFAY